MKKSILALWAILLVVTMMLSGCLVPFWPGEEGGGGGHRGGHEREHGDHEDHGDRGERR